MQFGLSLNWCDYQKSRWQTCMGSLNFFISHRSQISVKDALSIGSCCCNECNVLHIDPSWTQRRKTYNLDQRCIFFIAVNIDSLLQKYIRSERSYWINRPDRLSKWAWWLNDVKKTISSDNSSTSSSSLNSWIISMIMCSSWMVIKLFIYRLYIYI